MVPTGHGGQEGEAGAVLRDEGGPDDDGGEDSGGDECVRGAYARDADLGLFGLCWGAKVVTSILGRLPDDPADMYSPYWPTVLLMLLLLVIDCFTVLG